MILPRFLARVGSPVPEKVMTSGLVIFRAFFNSCFTTSGGTKVLRPMVFSVVRPKEQYTQSKEQIFSREQIGSIPSDLPSRQEETGP
jgi:hypothetical protein